MNPAPVLQTERLVLRGHRAEDFDAYFAMVSDPEVMRFINKNGTPREQAWARMLRYPGMWALLGFGMWVIEERSTGRFLGEAGFLESKRDLDPSIEGSLEMGWILIAEAQGRGLATEAVTAAIDWSRTLFSGRRMTCIIDPDNTASLRVAAKHGFREFARTTYNTSAVVLLERLNVQGV